MGSILRKISSVLFGVFIMSFFLMNISYAGTYLDTYYSDDVSEEISKGVTHISGTRLTNKGLIKIEIVKIDLTNKDIKFENVFNSDSMGKKTTLNNLIKNKQGVVAAINGDFFEISLTPSFELGMTINNGDIQKLSSGEYYNCYSDSLCSLLLDNNNKPYLDFVKTNVIFENDKDSLYVSYYNKSGDKEGTVILDGDFFSTSYSMDNRNPNTYKIVVEKGKKYDTIKEILEPGTTIDITKDIYVVFLPVNFNRIENFEVGDRVNLKFDLTIDDDIETSIGGAGLFLENGQVVSKGYILTQSTARSFVGYDSSKKYLYIGVVGGLTNANSGVTSNQLGEIVKEYGVYTAMHLDGGGSSTIATKSAYDNKVKQVNDVKTQRAIINAFVVSNNSSNKKVNGIKLDITDKAILNSTVPFDVIAYDQNHNQVNSFSPSGLKITADKEVKIDYNKKTISFYEKGRTNLKVNCSGYNYEMYVDIYDSLTEIQILPDPILIDVKEEKELSIIAFTGEKYKILIDPDSCEYEISPSSLAKVVDGKIKGLQNGVGTVTVYYDGLSASSILSVGREIITLDNFSYLNMSPLSYPESAKCDIDNDNGKLQINYSFEKSDITQASYAKYNSGIAIPQGATKLIMDVKGDGKGCTLKIAYVNTLGETFDLTVCDDINFKNTKEISVDIPAEIAGKATIERYYVVTLNTAKAIDSTIEIDNVRVEKNLNYQSVKPIKSITRDYISYDKSIDSINDKDILFFNNSDNKTILSHYLDNKISKVLKDYDVEKVIYHDTDNVQGINCNDGLKKYEMGDSIVVCMSTIAGSPFAKDPYQYGQLENIINNCKKENIIITLDGDLNQSSLSKDKVMLDYIFSKYYSKCRVNFYVVMFQGTTASDITENGIRYIRIPSKLDDAFSNNLLVLRYNEEGMMSYNLISYDKLLKSKKEKIEDSIEDNINEIDEDLTEDDIINEE